MHHAAQDPTYVVLSVLVATFGSWTALDLFRRVRAHSGRAHLAWLGAAALAMGLSIWAMHFIAMLGFDPGSPVRYDVRLTGLSLVLAIGATGVAFFVASHGQFQTGRVLLAGLVMGSGICLMHYVGMAALRSAVSLGYGAISVGLSFAVAVTASTAALIAGRKERSIDRRAGAALLLGLAIVGMHYTAMAGLRLAPAAGTPVSPAGVEPMALAFQVTLGAVVLLSLGLLASFFDRRTEIIGAMDAGRVGYWEMSLPQQEFQGSARTLEILGLAGDRAPIPDARLREVIHPDDREGRDTLLRAAIASGSDYSADHRITLPGGGVRWVDVRGRVLTDVRGRPRKITGVVLDVSSRHEAYAAAEESERRFRTMADSAPALIWMSDAEGRITFANRHYEQVFGKPADSMAENGWRGVVHPDDLEAFERGFFEAFAQREPVTLYTRVLDREGKQRWLRCEAVPRRQANGAFVGYTGCNVDVTEAKLAEEHQQLLLRELDHRVKNTLTVVMGIAAQTARSSRSIEDFTSSFMERVSALSRAHSLLTAQHWESTSLHDLADVVLAPHIDSEDRLSFEGPVVLLTPKAALAMSLILHELITNAAKHGALSIPQGRIVLDWTSPSNDAGRKVRLRWRETGVSDLRPPSRRGFGTKLIEASVRMELGGSSSAQWRDDGLEQMIEFPLPSGGGT
ncbi:MAG: PAS domain S-box protein [Proteobacteria bacterium]|nr:PAS domain S-box protein [Pseudomonadota bacterium]